MSAHTRSVRSSLPSSVVVVVGRVMSCFGNMMNAWDPLPREMHAGTSYAFLQTMLGWGGVRSPLGGHEPPWEEPLYSVLSCSGVGCQMPQRHTGSPLSGLTASLHTWVSCDRWHKTGCLHTSCRGAARERARIRRGGEEETDRPSHL